jgi:hypothetical protein
VDDLAKLFVGVVVILDPVREIARLLQILLSWQRDRLIYIHRQAIRPSDCSHLRQAESPSQHRQLSLNPVANVQDLLNIGRVDGLRQKVGLDT